MTVDPDHRYSNESERTGKDIYDDFKLKKPFDLQGFQKNQRFNSNLMVTELS